MNNTVAQFLTRKWTGLLGRARARFSDGGECQTLRLRGPHELGPGKARLPWEGLPAQLLIGDYQRLNLYPETRLGDSGDAPGQSLIVADPRAQLCVLTGFLRLSPGERLTLGRGDPLQTAMFGFPPSVEDYHLVLAHDGEGILVRNLTDRPVLLSPLLHDVHCGRQAKLRRLRDLFGGPIERLEPQAALSLIRDVNDLMEREPYRALDSGGRPGGLLDLPAEVAPILVADLHAQVDNLLTVLSQNGFLEALEMGGASLIIIGDGVHSEVDGQMEQMDDSMLMMDLIFKLKLRFPKGVFYLRGNHDSFSPDIAKSGIPQGLLWAEALRRIRGPEYLREMERYYGLLPFVLRSPHLISCHAAPPRAKVTPDMLVEIRRYPGLMRELVTNRLQRPHRPQGYTKGDVRRFRKSLGLGPATPLIVGHTPLDPVNTLWTHVDGIEDHHVLYSAALDWVGLFARVGEVMAPLRYPVEPLRQLIGALDGGGGPEEATRLPHGVSLGDTRWPSLSDRRGPW